ncbi:hypothetical protein C8J57DRAFT_1465706 [Mycena rebaudengoi]|nr:hypothetical protein C8J57DRAFT_1465706 [Mycena rebaudengoi]
MSPQRLLAELVARSLGSLLRAPRRWRSFCLPTRWRDRPCVHIFEGPPASFWFPPSPAALGPLCGAHTMRNCAVAFGFGADNGYASRNRVRWRTCRSLMPLHALSIARVREAGRSSRQVSAIVRGRLGVVPGPCTPPSMPARRMYAWARDHTPEQGIDADTVCTDADDSVHVPAPSVSHSLFHTGSPSTPKQRRGVSAASPPLAYSRPWRHARIAQRRTGAIRRSRAPHAGGSERPAGAPSPQAHAVARHILATVASVIKPARAMPAGSQKCACGGGEHRRPLRRPQRCLLTYAHTRPRTCDTSIWQARTRDPGEQHKRNDAHAGPTLGGEDDEGGRAAGRKKSSQEAAVGAKKSVYTAVPPIELIVVDDGSDPEHIADQIW